MPEQNQEEPVDREGVDQPVTDDGKTEADLWNEIAAAESDSAAASTPEKSKDEDAGATGNDKANDDAEQGDQGKDAEAARGKAAGGQDAPGGDASKSTPAAATEIDWSKAAPEFRAAFEATQAELKRAQQTNRANAGRASALQRQLNDMTARERGRQTDSGHQQGAGKGTPSASQDSLLDDPEIKAVVEEYPEVAKPIVKKLGEMVDRQAKREQAEDASRHAALVAEQEALLTKEHNDWDAVAGDPAFGAWLGDQPQHIQDAAQRNAKEIVDYRQAADVIGRFKVFRSAQSAQKDQPGNGQGTTGSLSDRRRRQLESSSAARSRGPGVAHGIPEDGDEQALWDAFGELDKRRASGRA